MICHRKGSKIVLTNGNDTNHYIRMCVSVCVGCDNIPEPHAFDPRELSTK